MIYLAYINELEGRPYQHVRFDMEDWSFVYFTAKDKGEEIEINLSRKRKCLSTKDWI